MTKPQKKESSGMTKAKKIWMDGELIKWEDANVHVLTHTLHYGLGAFEGIRCYRTENGSAVFRLREHVERLFNSAKIAGLKIPYKKEEIITAVKNTIRANDLTECYIRPLVFLGNNKLGLDYRNIDIHTIIAAWPWGAYLGKDGLTKGIAAKISSFSRHHINITMTKAKLCGSYVNSILAKSEAISAGYDEAILLDHNGYVSEGSGENIFIVRGDTVKTPPLAGVLEGITRDSVIAILEREGIKVIEDVITRDELYIADEAFFTGTAAEITPIVNIDGRVIGEGEVGKIVKNVQKIYFSAVQGRDRGFSDWLDEV